MTSKMLFYEHLAKSAFMFVTPEFCFQLVPLTKKKKQVSSNQSQFMKTLKEPTVDHG